MLETKIEKTDLFKEDNKPKGSSKLNGKIKLFKKINLEKSALL